MKKLLVLLLAIVLVVAVSAPPASADGGRIWQGRGGWGEHRVYRGAGGCVGCGFLGGLILGGILGGVLAAPYAALPPVYAPPPTCYAQPGYWAQVPYARPDGYTAYRNVWVPPQTVCR